MTFRPMMCQAVIGGGFGDEGKGKVVSYLSTTSPNPLVIRYCGGQQAGHHVVINDKLDHVFANFGSGTLQGFDTYWSKYCTVDPVGIFNELKDLNKKGIKPKLLLDQKCSVTTPFEKYYNETIDKNLKHGTCGVGVGQTHQRENDYYSLLVLDLIHPTILKIKLELIRQYYNTKIIKYGWKEEVSEFLNDCEYLVNSESIKIVKEIPNLENYSNFLFEGSQGLLLDQHFGFFPHVTRSNTGSKNINQMGFSPEVFLVTRAYQTRHGNGPMTNEDYLDKFYKENPYEQNLDSGIQGVFRITPLDLDLLKYGISRDKGIQKYGFNLVITCLDLLEEYILTVGGKPFKFKNEIDFVSKIRFELNVNNVFLSRTPFPELEPF